jgi:hypothetical protein
VSEKSTSRKKLGGKLGQPLTLGLQRDPAVVAEDVRRVRNKPFGVRGIMLGEGEEDEHLPHKDLASH